MKKLFLDAPEVPQSTANRAVRIVEKHLRVHRVDRARDLPEEAKVRLLRDLRVLFEADLGEGGPPGLSAEQRRGWFARLMERMESFLSFGEG